MLEREFIVKVQALETGNPSLEGLTVNCREKSIHIKAGESTVAIVSRVRAGIVDTFHAYTLYSLHDKITGDLFKLISEFTLTPIEDRHVVLRLAEGDIAVVLSDLYHGACEGDLVIVQEADEGSVFPYTDTKGRYYRESDLRKIGEVI